MSQTLASLSASVQTILKRPDLAADVTLHLQNSLLKALFETNFSFASPATQYSLDYKSLIPRFKTIKYLNTVDSVNLLTLRPLTPIPVEKFIDGYSYIRDYVFYLAGSNIQIRVSDQAQYFGLGCYLYPDVTLVAPSWIADEFPFAIIYETLRTLYKILGYDEMSASAQTLVQEAMAEVRMVGITTAGS